MRIRKEEIAPTCLKGKEKIRMLITPYTSTRSSTQGISSVGARKCKHISTATAARYVIEIIPSEQLAAATLWDFALNAPTPLRAAEEPPEEHSSSKHRTSATRVPITNDGVLRSRQCIHHVFVWPHDGEPNVNAPMLSPVADRSCPWSPPRRCRPAHAHSRVRPPRPSRGVCWPHGCGTGSLLCQPGAVASPATKKGTEHTDAMGIDVLSRSVRKPRVMLV